MAASTSKKRENLQRLLRPQHIAFIGGDSSAPGIKATLAGGFDGPVWSVNPKRGKKIAGLACYPSVADLPQPPDASFIWAPREATIEIVRQLAETGRSEEHTSELQSQAYLVCPLLP